MGKRLVAKKNMYTYVGLIACVFCVLGHVYSQGEKVLAGGKSFLVPKSESKKEKNMSKGTLKENIGQQTRDAFHVSTELGKLMGTVLVNMPTDNAAGSLCKPVGSFQIQLASIQNSFSKIIETLVDDAKPFKKAKRKDLCSAYECMKKVNQNMSKQLQNWRAIQKSVSLVSGDQGAASGRVKKITDDMQRCVANLKTLDSDMHAQACLKTV